jgi:hypothetical protein
VEKHSVFSDFYVNKYGKPPVHGAAFTFLHQLRSVVVLLAPAQVKITLSARLWLE